MHQTSDLNWVALFEFGFCCVSSHLIERPRHTYTEREGDPVRFLQGSEAGRGGSPLRWVYNEGMEQVYVTVVLRHPVLLPVVLPRQRLLQLANQIQMG